MWYGRVRETEREEGRRSSVVMGHKPDAPLSLTEMEVKCSFMWRNTHKGKDGGQGGSMMTLSSSKGHSFGAHRTVRSILLTTASKQRTKTTRRNRQCGASAQDE